MNSSQYETSEIRQNRAAKPTQNTESWIERQDEYPLSRKRISVTSELALIALGVVIARILALIALGVVIARIVDRKVLSVGAVDVRRQPLRGVAHVCRHAGAEATLFDRCAQLVPQCDEMTTCYNITRETGRGASEFGMRLDRSSWLRLTVNAVHRAPAIIGSFQQLPRGIPQ